MPHEFVATWQGKDMTVRLEHRGHSNWSATIDGRPVLADVEVIASGVYSILVGTHSFLAVVDTRNAQVQVGTREHLMSLGIEDARLRRVRSLAQNKNVARSGDEIVRAPIAGRVVKLLCEPGQTVAAGEGVIVVEAMKMENEIRAEHGGTVARIHVEPGASLESGQPLVTLKHD
jgi:biotin carboxyl carrier protein